MHSKGFCNLIWAAWTTRRSAFQETDIDTYLAFTYINTLFFCTLRARYFGLAKLIAESLALHSLVLFGWVIFGEG